MGIEFLIEPLKYDFMVRALITAFLSGIMLSVLGSFTINKNMGFMARKRVLELYKEELYVDRQVQFINKVI